MRLASSFVSVVAVLSVAACSGTSTGDGSSGTSGTPSTPGSSGTPGTPSTSGMIGTPSTSGMPSTSGGVPTASPIEAAIDTDGTCSAFSACPGEPQGTYDYKAGCLADAFAAARAQCPSLDTTNAKATVTGSLYFAKPALTRDAVVKISGSIIVPASCSGGQCTAVETALKGAFDSVTCTGSSACTCTVAKTNTVKNATTYSINGSTITTDDGDSYKVCAQADSFRYAGKSLDAEDGNWELVKRK